MKVIIEAEAKEIASLVLAIQGKLDEESCVDMFANHLASAVDRTLSASPS